MITAVIREAYATAISQRVVSVITVLMVAGMVLAVMLTTGRTVGAEQRVLDSVDSAGTRSITIRIEPDAGVTTSVLERMSAITGIEWAGAFSSAIDARNASIADGTRVPIRYIYSYDLTRLSIPKDASRAEVAFASPLALEQLGLPDVAGAVTLKSGETYSLSGRIKVPEFLEAYQPLLVVPRPLEWNESVTIITVVAERPDLVAPLADVLTSILGVDDPTKIRVQSSEALAELRAIVEGEFGSYSRGLILGLLAVTGSLLAVLLYGLVLLRRRDFGRRRALGASRSFIVWLLLTQSLMLGILGLSAGMAVAVSVLVWTGDPLPGVEFTVALAVLTLSTMLIAALVPAVVASRREPIRELRVP